MRKCENTLNSSKGITLIALVVTIIILIILAGISISMLTGQNGILTRAAEAKEKTEKAQAEEQSALSELESQMNNYQDDGFDKEKGVNRPQLASGMTRVMFTNPTSSSNGEIIKDGENGWSTDWYDYNSQKWANVMTKDGSMWVWIPRYAYIINADKSMDIKFLVGTTNKWYNQETKKTEDLPEGYKVHPCFQNGSKTGYQNGEWKAEIRGIWVAKFEAGLPDESSAPKTTAVTGMGNSYYPVFQGKKCSYNNINVSECYLLSKTLTETNNPYGFSSSTDSHLIKNSEWGAAAYLSYSKYGKTGGKYDTTKEVYINNVSYGYWGQSSIKTTVRGNNGYAVTGYAGDNASQEQNILSSTTLGDTVTGTKTSYAWYTNNGIKASTTGNMYGIYDMSGGLAEYTASYVKVTSANVNYSDLSSYLQSYGKAFVFANGSSGSYKGNTEYVTEYPEYASGKIFDGLASRYGDGFYETQTWFGDWENNDASGPFFTRGAYWHFSSCAGVFGFDDDLGYSYYDERFPYRVGGAVALRTFLVT